MMINEKVKNNKKAIIVVIIMLVILTLSTTIAFFTDSESGNTDNIVTTDSISLDYQDDKTLMKGDLIPVSITDVEQFFNSENTCVYNDGTNNYNACSIYEFTITNESNVSQELVITLNPTANSFTNLNYMLYKVENNVNNKIVTKQLNNITSYNLLSGTDKLEDVTTETTTLILNGGESATYKILFFIKDIGVDQTSQDAGKQFGAGIRIDSITTGKYIVEKVGANCWETQEVTEEDIQNYGEYGVTNGTYKLTAFTGLNQDTGVVREECINYMQHDESDDSYSVNIPSNVGGQSISMIGKSLFFPVVEYDEVEEMPIFNNYVKIKEINMSEGITVIEDCIDDEFAAFIFIGYDYADDSFFNVLNVNFPSSLKYIGNSSFYLSSVQEINFNEGLIKIGDYAFEECYNLTTINLPSTLQEIGSKAFKWTALNYPDEEHALVIPASVTSIGKYAFLEGYMGKVENPNLKYIKYLGTNESVIANNPRWYYEGYLGATLITPNYNPAS